MLKAKEQQHLTRGNNMRTIEESKQSQTQDFELSWKCAYINGAKMLLKFGCTAVLQSVLTSAPELIASFLNLSSNKKVSVGGSGTELPSCSPAVVFQTREQLKYMLILCSLLLLSHSAEQHNISIAIRTFLRD